MSRILQMTFGNGPAISMFLKQQKVTKTNQQAQESGSAQLVFVFVWISTQKQSYNLTSNQEDILKLKRVTKEVPFCGTVNYTLTVNKSFWACGWNLLCDHSNETHQKVLPYGIVNHAVQGGSNFWVCGWNPKVWPFKWKLLSSTFLWYCVLCCKKWFSPTLASVDEIL